jgi:hypothetical protein
MHNKYAIVRFIRLGLPDGVGGAVKSNEKATVPLFFRPALVRATRWVAPTGIASEGEPIPPWRNMR